MHSVSDFLGFAVWATDGTLERALCLSPRYGIVEDRGDRLPFEQAYWAGQHPVEDVDDEPYPLPFHPLDLGEAALAALFGFIMEGFPLDGMVDLEQVPLAGFRLGGPMVTLERSHGHPIVQPSALEVDSQVRRLGDGLDYLIVDRGGEHYVQAAAGGRYEVPAGVFWVEVREGGPDRHFRCEVASLDDVADIFLQYRVSQDRRDGRHWAHIRL